MSSTLSAADWEAMYAPYDRSMYQAALGLLRPEDIVLDIGAGDLQFSCEVARKVKKVYAVEVNPFVLKKGLESHDSLPDELIPICADARTFDFPTNVTVGILLMRHCTHFHLYFEKLVLAGARRLITNARWHMDVEEVNLKIKRASFNEIGIGWYACLCGAVGFKLGPVEQWSNEMDGFTYEVFDCLQCGPV